MQVLIIVALFGVTFAATVKPTPAPVPCMSDADCTSMECCYKEHDSLVVSKRDGTFEGFPVDHQDLSHTEGVCQSYHMDGDSCSVYDKANGYCSCNDKQGYSCQITNKDATGFAAMYGNHSCQKGLLLSKK